MKKILKNGICFIIFFLFINFFCVAQTESDWVVAATEFSYKQNIARNQFEKSVLQTIPSLILEQIYGTKIRNIPSEEILNRKTQSLVKERLALFLELSKEQKTKDTIILKDLSQYQFKKQLSDQDKKIKNINKQIDENLKKQEKILKEFSEEKSEFSKLNSKEENFFIYQNDTNFLFKFSNQIKEIDYTFYECQKEIVAANIDALITGSVITYGDYAAVTCQMFLYPGATSACVITEVGLLSNPEAIAKNIAYRLIPKIQNAIPCQVQIKIQPEELLNKTKLTIDSTVYNKIPDNLILSTGVHNFVFECEGYRKESFSYGFGYEKKYLIDVTFVKEELLDIAVALKKSIEGNFFYNGKKSDSNVMSVKINNRGILGYYLTQKNNSIFFLIPKNQIIDDKTLMLNIKDYSIADYIEKRRRMMYISYSALVCSLPFTFYTYSNYSTLLNSYNMQVQNISIDEIKKFQTLSYVAIGISVGCGIWFLTELIFYLNSANKVLPVEVKKSNLDFDFVVEQYQTEQTLLKEQREEQEKILKAQQEANQENVEKENSEIENSEETNINTENENLKSEKQDIKEEEKND